MTGPRWHTSIDSSQGIYSSYGERERRAFFEELQRYGRSSSIQPVSLMGAVSPQAQHPPTQQLEPPASLPDSSLIGRATYWGIPEESARMMPREALISVIEENERRQGGGGPLFGLQNDLRARLALGASRAAVGMLKHLPFIGEQLEKTELIQSADQWIGQFEEAARATKGQGMTGMLQAGAEFGGAMSTFIVPGTGAWKLAGWLGKIVPVAGAMANPIIRVAAQGGSSAWMLEGRGLDNTLVRVVKGEASEDDLQQLVRSGFVVGTGAGAGAAIQGLVQYAPAIQEMASKLGKAFGGSWQKRVAPAGTPKPSMLYSDAWEAHVPEQGMSWQNLKLEDDLTRVADDVNLPLDARESAKAIRDEIAQARKRARVSVQESVQEADAAATQMTKQQLIAESSIAPQALRQSIPDETTVAVAGMIDNPGGINIVPGIPDPAKFIESLAPAGTPIRFVQRPGSKALDALIGDDITDEMVKQFEINGLFQGQQVMSGGTLSRIVQWAGDTVVVQPMYGGTMRHVPINSVMSMPTSPGVRKAPALWESLQNYANQRVVAANEAMGGTLTPARLLQMKNENLPQYMDMFLDEAGIVNTGQRAQLKEYFGQRFVDDFKALAPDENALQQSVMAQAAAAESANPLSIGARLEQKAASKGFNVVYDGRTGTWMALDLNNLDSGLQANPAKQISFESQEALERWIDRFHINRPDITPPSDIPLEVAEGFPTQGLYDPITPDAGQLVQLQRESMMEVADDLAETLPDVAMSLRQQVEEAAATGNLGKIQSAWEYGFALLQPMRARFLEIERGLAQAGGAIGEVKPWTKIYDPVQTAQTQYHRFTAPWLERAAGIIAKFDRQDIRTGKVTQLWELVDPATRKAAAAAAKFTPRQIEALDEVEAYIEELGGPGAARKVADYISRLRIRQSLPLAERADYAMPDVDELTKPFAEFAEGNSLQVRALDTSVMLNALARSKMYQQHLAPTWQPAWESAQQIASTEGMQNLGEFTKNWLHTVRYGYDPRPDQFLSFTHSVASALIPGITKSQVRTLFGRSLSVTHRALLGWQPHVLARDSMQLLLSIPRVGTDLLDVMRQYATANKVDREAMWKRALDGGWVVPGQPRIASPGILEDPLVYVADEVAPVAQVAESKRYRAIQRVADVAYNRLPESARHLSGTKADPLWAYTKMSERMRLLPGFAMAQRADRVIAAWKAKPAGTASFDELIRDTRASTFDVSIQEQFKQYIAAGDDKGAADFLGRQTAHSTQFLYGQTENPEVGRTIGGRIGMQMGNFSTQFYQYLRESLRNGTPADKARFLGLMGSVYGAFKLGKAATGWDFDKWQFHRSLTFTGGPMVQPIADALSGAAATGQAVWQEGGRSTNTGYYQEQQMGRTEDAMNGLFRMINPAGGAMRTANGITQALESPTPGEALARLMVTGERGASQDWSEEFSRVFGAPPPPMPQPQQMQPYTSPVRGRGFGMPPGGPPGMPQP